MDAISVPSRCRSQETPYCSTNGFGFLGYTASTNAIQSRTSGRCDGLSPTTPEFHIQASSATGSPRKRARRMRRRKFSSWRLCFSSGRYSRSCIAARRGPMRSRSRPRSPVKKVSASTRTASSSGCRSSTCSSSFGFIRKTKSNGPRHWRRRLADSVSSTIALETGANASTRSVNTWTLAGAGPRHASAEYAAYSASVRTSSPPVARYAMRAAMRADRRERFSGSRAAGR